MAANPHENFHDKPQLGPLEAPPAKITFHDVMANEFFGKASAAVLNQDSVNFGDKNGAFDAKHGTLDTSVGMSALYGDKVSQAAAKPEVTAMANPGLNFDQAPPLKNQGTSLDEAFRQADAKVFQFT